MKLYIAHIINDVVRQGTYDYHKVPLFHTIQYAGTDYIKAQAAICDIVYGEHKYCRYEELDDRNDDFLMHEYAFKYIPIDENGNDIELPEGCYGIYYADVEEIYNEE